MHFERFACGAVLTCGLLAGMLTASAAPFTIEEHADIVTALAFAPDGSLLASGSADRTAKLFDPSTGEPTHTLTHPAAIVSLAFSPNARGLASGTADDTVFLWTTSSGRLMEKFTGDRTGDRAPTTPCAAFSPDSRLLASGHRGGLISLYDIKNRARRSLTFPGDPAPCVTAIAFSNDGKLLAAAAGNKAGLRQIAVWDLAATTPPRQFTAPGLVEFLAFPAGDRLLLFTLKDGSIICINAADGKERARVRGKGEPVAIALSAPRGRILIVGSEGSKLIDLFGKAGRNLPGAGSAFSVAALHLGPSSAQIARSNADAALTIAPLVLRTAQDLTVREIDRRLRSLERREKSLTDEVRRLDKRIEAARNRREDADNAQAIRLQQASIMLDQVQTTREQLETLREQKAESEGNVTTTPRTRGWDTTNLTVSERPATAEPPLDAILPAPAANPGGIQQDESDDDDLDL